MAIMAGRIWKIRKARRRLLFGIGISVIVLLLVGVISVGVGSYVSIKRWDELKDRLESDGQTMVFADIIPAPVPDDLNFGAAPALTNLRLPENAAKREHLECMVDWNREGLEEYEFRGSDLNRLSYSQARDLLAYLEEAPAGSFDAESRQEIGERLLGRFNEADEHGIFLELSRVSQLPESQLIPGWEKLAENPKRLEKGNDEIDALRAFAFTNSKRITAALWSGDDEVFTEAFETQVQIARALSNEPTMIGPVFGMVPLVQAIGAVWERLLLRGVDPETLVRWDIRMTSVALDQMLLTALQGEMIQAADIIGDLATDRDSLEILNDGGALGLGLTFSGSGAVALVKEEATQNFYDYFVVPARSGWRQSWEGVGLYHEEVEAAVQKNPLRAFARMMTETMPIAVDNIILTESMLRRARIAIALERFFLTKGSYPAALSDLVPTFLSEIPGDPVTSGRTGYRKDPDNGRYVLWHVGLDGEDDGGRIIPDPGGGEEFPKINRRDYEGDWVWRYPASSAK